MCLGSRYTLFFYERTMRQTVIDEGDINGV